MPTHQTEFRRYSIRLPSYDYHQTGFYFVTICTQDRKCLLSSVIQREMYLNDVGSIVQSVWSSLPGRFEHVRLDQYCVMPNHLHGIVVLEEFSSVSLGNILRAFKAAATHQIRATGKKAFAWQSDYYEHIVRNEKDLTRIRQYILDNPARWTEDRFYAEMK
jgi:REP element-mobilizing transposase RayT